VLHARTRGTYLHSLKPGGLINIAAFRRKGNEADDLKNAVGPGRKKLVHSTEPESSDALRIKEAAEGSER